MRSSDDERPSSRPQFWDTRYEDTEYLFGQRPNAFVASVADRMPEGCDVLELGAGEGRTLAWLARERGIQGTAIDFSERALRTLRRWARTEDLPIEAVEADVCAWRPDRQWDAVIVTFLQLIPGERSSLYETIHASVRPGGLVIGAWFRPDYLSDDYDRLGPSSADRMVPVAELAEAFSDYEHVQCEPADVELDEGPVLTGQAAVARLCARKARRE